MSDTPDPLPVLESLHGATRRLVRSVDSLDDEGWRAPSLLPGWNRAHLVAHLALNAEALAGVLDGVHGGRAVPMYESQQARDHDIEELSTAEPGRLRERLLASTGHFADAVAAMDEQDWGQRFDRVPGGPTPAAAAVPAMRWREVEIHHADLLVGYSHRDWPVTFVAPALDSMTARLRDLSPGFHLVPSDLDGSREVGSVGPDAPAISGTAADAVWWLSGRGDGTGMSSERGDLPQIGAW